MRDYCKTKMPGHYPFSFGYYSDGLVLMQNHFRETSKKYLQMGAGGVGEIQMRQVVTLIVDRIKGHVFIMKNGRLLSQDISPEEKEKKITNVFKLAMAKSKANKLESERKAEAEAQLQKKLDAD